MSTAPPPPRGQDPAASLPSPSKPRSGSSTWRRLVRHNPVSRYAHWLHTMWPAGGVEKLPVADEHGRTNVPGLYLVGDVSGVPLLKLSANAGARVARRIADELEKAGPAKDEEMLDVVIVGGGTAGFAAALECKKRGLMYVLLEANEPFSTIVNFPKGKPIYLYPTEQPVEADFTFHEKSEIKEGLLEDLREQTVDRDIEWMQARVSHVRKRRNGLGVVIKTDAGEQEWLARRVIVGIGRSGNYRKLGVPGEDLPKVYNRLYDPSDSSGQDVLVVGGGDSAIETAIALTEAGANVTLSYRGQAFNRAKPENVEAIERLARNPHDSPAAEHEGVDPTDHLQSVASGDYLVEDRPVLDKVHTRGRPGLRLLMGSNVKAIGEDTVDVETADGQIETIPNDTVFTMIGREAPLDFFRQSGVRIHNEHNWAFWSTMAAFLLLCVWVYHWKKGGVTITGIESVDYYLDIGSRWSDLGWFPYGFTQWLASLGDAWANPANLLGTLRVSFNEPGFFYSLAYCACVVGFGIDRVVRKPTPYIKKQTTILALIQVIPLFVLPYLILPWMGQNGWFDSGLGGWFADTFFPRADYTEHGREYWRAFGFILAWPLFIWNVFTYEPLWGWLIVSVVQTFVLIPLGIYFFGKGVYCGWICSCGALAETLGDRHREKMPHGPFWNGFNMLGQVFLFFAFALLVFRILGWMGWTWAAEWFNYLLNDLPLVNYVWFVDLLWAGILGVGLYFWFSGRVWCRFACPLAALMHVYHRFSRFAIIPEKKRCISCNVCTSVCHQGIDVMSFANKGLPMRDPQCVRCSACVTHCPTGVLQFGQVDRDGKPIWHDPDWLAASPVLIRESKPIGLTVNGKTVRR